MGTFYLCGTIELSILDQFVKIDQYLISFDKWGVKIIVI